MIGARTVGPIWLLLFFCLAGWGQQAPALSVSRWLQGPDGFDGSWNKLRGKVVVLEFWATWCSPCVQAISHLNQLATDFQGQGVLFLAVTDDDTERLEPFLVKHPIKAIIGIDTEHRTADAFAVPSIPHTVLIAKDGSVVGATFPENITNEVLREVLSNKKPNLPAKEGIPSDLEWDDHSIDWQDGVAPEMYAIIKPIKTLTSGVWPRPGHITADGVPLQVLVQVAYQTDNFHMVWRVPSDNRLYRAAFRVPEDRKERLLPYMQQSLADLFGIEVRWEKQQRDVYVLRRLHDRAPPQQSPSGQEMVQMLRGKITLRRQPVIKLCQMLTPALDAIVVDETGMEGRYDFDVPYQHGETEPTTQALKNIGLEVVKARREIQVLNVAHGGVAQGKKP